MKRLLLFAMIGLLAACSSPDCNCESDTSGGELDLLDIGGDSQDTSQISPDLTVPDPDLSEVVPIDLVVDDVDEEIADLPYVDSEISDEVPDIPPVGCGDDECGDDEDCASCPEDCGDCPPELNWCLISGDAGDEVECEISLAAADDGSPKATQFQLDMNFDEAQVAYDGVTCPANDVDLCDLVGVLPTQHAINTAEQSPGVVRLIITKPGEPAPISEAYLSGDIVVGDSYVLDLVFSLEATIAEDAPVAVSLSNMVGSDAVGNPLNAVQDLDGLIVTD